MSTTFYYDPVFLLHETGEHPECPERLRRIMARLDETRKDAVIRTPRKAAIDELAGVHDRAYLDGLEEACSRAGYLDVDTAVSPRSFEAALTAAGAVLDCADALLRGDAGSAFALVRPPGHHARPTTSMGFCLINNVAVAADFLRGKGIDRILIVDFDVHHGNGTQEIFYDNGQVYFLSLHRYPFYPGSGGAGETGTGAGTGTTLNVPRPWNAPAGETVDAFRTALDRAASAHAPEILLVSAGFDTYRDDPVGGLGLLPEHFHEIGTAIGETADAHCHGRILTTLEGGYSLTGLPLCLDAYVDGLDGTQSNTPPAAT